MKSVSIILLCFNQEAFIAESMFSVWSQTYPNIQLIVVDDCSTDNSQAIIRSLLVDKPDIPFIANKKSLGNCAAFNSGLSIATGDFIIDLSGDDVLLHDGISKQVALFESLPESYGVVFSNARYIDEQGKHLKNHFSPSFEPPQGDIYKELISTYFIAPPTMMIRKEVLDALGGYDDELAYEDFDFWIRSSRNYRYAYLPEILVSIRRHSASLSMGWYKKGDKQLHSTYLVCLKIQKLNTSEEEKRSLIRRLRYEIRQSVFSANHAEAALFITLLRELGGLSSAEKALGLINRMKIDLSFCRKVYHWLVGRFSSPESHFQ